MGEVQACVVPEISSHRSPPLPYELPEEITLTERCMCDLEMLLSGAFHPLTGFMCEDDYCSVLNTMRLKSGKIWPIPIVLPINKNAVVLEACGNDRKTRRTETMRSGKNVVMLKSNVGTIVAKIDVFDVYEPDLNLEMEKTLGTTEKSHPYVKYLTEHHSNCYYIGGEVTAVQPIEYFNFVEYRMTAAECRESIKQKGWEVVIGFQTRNPMHRSHFELTQQAMREVEASTGKKSNLLLTPAIGPTQFGDINISTRVRAYKKILSHYHESNVQLVLLPISMRMAGPREAVWHALIRRNYGCTHFIVGRDHAGPSTKKSDGSSFYGPYEAHELIKSVESELGISPVLGRAMLYVGETHGGYLQADEVPDGVAAMSISGTEFRHMLQSNVDIPEWFSFADVVDELKKFYKPKHQMGLCVYFTGLPCSGKSTLANSMQARLDESETETRAISLLDADVIRTHLSHGLGFSRADRSQNIRRIGYVASEVTKHGGICLVANIAPYVEDREFNRQLITQSGAAYIEVYVSTPLEVCEGRDIKQLYKKARQGIIKQFTGISDPYQVPENAEIVIDSSSDINGKTQRILDYLREQKCII